MPFVVRADAVEDSIRELLAARIHPHFAGYLCVVRAAFTEGRTGDLRPDFKEFFDSFLRPPNGTDDLPYFRPFWNRSRPAGAWFNPNVAGTYAPSSIRPGQPLYEVIDAQGVGASARYSLREGHAHLALRHLASGRPVLAVPLATFLYRDFALIKETPPSVGDLVRIFQDEFGYIADDGTPTDGFATLYQDDSGAGETAELFEELP